MHKFILIWKAKWTTPFSVIQGTIAYLLVYLALEINQGKHGWHLPFGRIMDCLFFLYQRSQTFSPRLHKEQDSRLYIGPAVGFHVIPKEGVLSYVVPDL